MRATTLRKKLSSFVAVVAVLLLDRWVDFGLSGEDRRLLVFLAIGYLISQGLADFGKDRLVGRPGDRKG